MSLALAEAPSQSTQALSKVFGHINKLDKIEEDVIALLPSMSDDEVLDTRIYAKTLGRSAWRIEIACDAELWNRTQARRGRGNVDTEGLGIKATVAKRAADLGCTARTIENNARIHKLVESKKNDESTFTILDEKGYWHAALCADDPDDALDHFVAEKAEKPFFSVSDAYRWSKDDKESDAEREHHKARFKSDRSEVEAVYDAGVQSDLSRYITLVTEFEEIKWPGELGYFSRMFQAHKTHAHFQKTRNVHEDCEEIMTVVKRLCPDYQAGFEISAQNLYDWVFDLGFCMSKKEFKARLVHMSGPEVRLLLFTDAGDGKQDNRRGALPGIITTPWALKREKPPVKKKLSKKEKEEQDWNF